MEVRDGLAQDDPEPERTLVQTLLDPFLEDVVNFFKGRPTQMSLVQMEQAYLDLKLVWSILKRARADRTGRLVVQNWLLGNPTFQMIEDQVKNHPQAFQPNYLTDLLDFLTDPNKGMQTC